MRLERGQREMGGMEGDRMSTRENRDGWDLHIFGPGEADDTVVITEQPARTAELILELVSADSGH
jgi:hypothetical protein